MDELQGLGMKWGGKCGCKRATGGILLVMELFCILPVVWTKELIQAIKWQLLIPLPSPAPSNLCTIESFYLSEFDYSRYLISGIIQYLSFCDWLISLSIAPSRFIHIVSCVRMPHFLRPNNIPLSIWTTFCLSVHPSRDIWVASTFWPLWIMLLWAWVYKQLLFPPFLAWWRLLSCLLTHPKTVLPPWLEFHVISLCFICPFFFQLLHGLWFLQSAWHRALLWSQVRKALGWLPELPDGCVSQPCLPSNLTLRLPLCAATPPSPSSSCRCLPFAGPLHILFPLAEKPFPACTELLKFFRCQLEYHFLGQAFFMPVCVC